MVFYLFLAFFAVVAAASIFSRNSVFAAGGTEITPPITSSVIPPPTLGFPPLPPPPREAEKPGASLPDTASFAGIPPPPLRDPFQKKLNITVEGPPYSPPPLIEHLNSEKEEEFEKLRVLSSPAVIPFACSSWAYRRIHAKVDSIMSGDNGPPNQQGVFDIRDVLDIIRVSLLGAGHITEIGVRDALSSWMFAAVASEAVDQGRPVTYRGLDITKKDGVEDLEAALWQCPGVDFHFTEMSDLLVTPWHTEVMLLDTWHTYKQLSLELPLWAPYVSRTLMLHDTSMYAYRDEDDIGQGGREINNTLFVGLKPLKGLWPAVEEFLASEEGSHWTMAHKNAKGNGLTVLIRK